MKEQLLQLARTGDRNQLQEAWIEWLESLQSGATEGSGDIAVEVARTLETIGQKPLAITLLGLLQDELRDKLPATEIGPALIRLSRLSPTQPGLRGDLIEALRGIHPGHPAIEGALKASGIIEGDSLSKEIDRFERYITFTPKRHVLHLSGWGAGRIESIDSTNAEIEINFEGKKNHRMTFEGVDEILEFLEDDDLRSMRFSRPEELERLASEDPSELLKKTVHSLGNTAPLSLIRDTLKGETIPEDSWSRWWTRAKKAAMQNPYLSVARDGRVKIREEPKSLFDEVGEKIDRGADLAAKWKIARTFLRSKPTDEERQQLAERIGPIVLDEQDLETFPEVAEALIFLEKEKIEGAEERLDLLAADSEWAVTVFSALSTKDEQLAFLGRVVRFGQEERSWSESFLGILVMGKSRVNKEIRQQLIDGGESERLGRLEAAAMEKPEEFPEPFLEILKGKWKPAASTWSPAQLVRPTLRFGASVDRSDDLTKAAKSRLIKQVEMFLCADDYTLLNAYITERSEDEVLRASSYLERSPSLSRIYGEVRSAIETRLPEVKETPPIVQFWEQADHIFVSTAGLTRRQTELRRVLDVDIPDNQEAIGRAAAFGDLSENAEYTAALEKQRELTTRASEISSEIERARLIEKEEIPKGIVAPGSRIRLSDLDKGTEDTWEILGPWDADVEQGIISYLTPIASAVLGKQVGDEATVVLPDRKTHYRILGIEMIFDLPQEVAAPSEDPEENLVENDSDPNEG